VTRSPLHVLVLVTFLGALASALMVLTRVREMSASPATEVAVVERWTTDRPVRRALTPKPRPPRVDDRFLIAHVRPGTTVALRASPSGPVVRRVGAWTEFGSRRALSVVRTANGRWLGVTSPELGNGTLGWIDARQGAVRYSRTPIRLEIDLSRRQLTVHEGRNVARRMTVGIGRSGSPTPTGRFAITDKLPGADYGPYYGRYILALSGRQPNLPAGWTGGDRLAIHGTPNPAGIGNPVSAGCLHASTEDLSLLMATAPVGTPVLIHA